MCNKNGSIYKNCIFGGWTHTQYITDSEKNKNKNLVIKKKIQNFNYGETKFSNKIYFVEHIIYYKSHRFVKHYLGNCREVTDLSSTNFIL